MFHTLMLAYLSIEKNMVLLLPMDLNESIFILLDAWNNSLAATTYKPYYTFFFVITWPGWKHSAFSETD